MTRPLRVKVFADTADIEGLRAIAADPVVRGFTTNPTLMRKAGVVDYGAFAREAIRIAGDRPISFEALGDDLREMREQALEMASWGPTVYVKIPVMTGSGDASYGLLADLAGEGVRVNVTALLTLEQVAMAARALARGPSAIVSVFAGRYADTGRDPVPMMAEAATIVHSFAGLELLWASPRELLNLVQAEEARCDIITMPGELLHKLPLLGKDLDQYSLETVRMFNDDAARAGYTIRVRDRSA